MRHFLMALACLTLAACGGGPSEPFMTAQSTAATKAAIDACATRVTSGRTLAQLTTAGFTQNGNRFVARSENPRMLVGGSIVRARMENRQTCLVTSEPVSWDELPTIQAMVRDAVAKSPRPLDATVRFNPGGGQVRVTVK